MDNQYPQYPPHNPFQQQQLNSYLQQQRPLPNATAVLVLGIISIVGCACYGVPGLICGIISLVLAKKDNITYKANPELYSLNSYSNLKAGRVCAIIGTSISAVFFLFMLAYFILIGTLVSSAEFQQMMKQVDHHN